MKIGVITFSNSRDNYGQMLQIYAMQRFLLNHGHEPFLIRYKEKSVPEASFKMSGIFKYIKNLPTYISLFFRLRQQRSDAKKFGDKTDVASRHFDDFLAGKVKCSETVYDAETIREHAPEADAYICGSDQIWGGDTAYYLDFAADNRLKIAYAPSFGGVSNFAPDYEDLIKRLVSRLDFVGLREQSGVELCHRLGISDAEKVVDPTLLLTAGDYDEIRTFDNHPRKYMLLYLLGNPIRQDLAEFYEYARSKGLDVVYIASQSRNDRFDKCPATIEQWIGLVAEAEIVITNSFHCTVFALIYNRPFVTVPLTGGFARMNSRVIELLETTGLQNRLLDTNLGEMSDEVDFSGFAQFQSRECLRSAKRLLDALSKH